MRKSFLNAGLFAALVASPASATGIQIEVAGEANGTVTIDLLEDIAPQHAERIAALAEAGAYDGVVFHRVIDGFMAQTGDVQFGKMGDDMRQAGFRRCYLETTTWMDRAARLYLASGFVELPIASSPRVP